jgi:hypothetical protein
LFRTAAADFTTSYFKNDVKSNTPDSRRDRVATLRYKFGKDMLTRDLALIAGNGEAPDVTANDATLSCLGEKESLD